MKSISSRENKSGLLRPFVGPLPAFLAFLRSRLVNLFPSGPKVSELVSVGVTMLGVEELRRSLASVPEGLKGVEKLPWSRDVIWRMIFRISLCLVWCNSSEALQLEIVSERDSSEDSGSYLKHSWDLPVVRCKSAREVLKGDPGDKKKMVECSIPMKCSC